MRVVLVILVLSLVIKDASHLNDRYILRGIAQGLCLVAGLAWLLKDSSITAILRYWPIVIYMAVLLIGGMLVTDQVYIVLQVSSLFSVVLFSIAFYESRSINNSRTNHLLLTSTVISYLVVGIISVALTLYYPSIVYTVQLDGAKRFHGLFGEPATMGTTAGLLIGLSLLFVKQKWLKYAGVIIGCVCLGLTLSRTFWIATIAALVITAWFYRLLGKKLMIAIFTMFVMAVAIGSLFEITIGDSDTKNVLREKSLINLSGRTAVWEVALKQFYKRPLAGYGFTRGGGALEGAVTLNQGFSYQKLAGNRGAPSLHNGYIQSLLDSGLLGFMFYIFIITFSVARLLKLDKARCYSVEFYIIVYLAIANLAESTIMSTSVLHSTLFWILAVFSLSIRPSARLTTTDRIRQE